MNWWVLYGIYGIYSPKREFQDWESSLLSWQWKVLKELQYLIAIRQRRWSFLYIFPWKTAALNWICFADILNVWRLKCDVRQFFAVWNPLWMAKSQMFHDVPLFYINHPKNRLNWLCLMVNSQFLVANLPSDCWIQAECAVESPVSLRRWPHLVGFYGQGSLGMSENGLYPNEIAIKSRDNDHQPLGLGYTIFRQTQLFFIFGWYCDDTVDQTI